MAIAIAAIASGCGDESEPAPTTTTGGGGSGGSATRPATGSGEDGVELTEIGSFEQPVYVADADDGSGDLYVVEQCGTIQRLPEGEDAPNPSSTSPRWSPAAASRGSSRSPSRPTTSAPAASTSTSPTSTGDSGSSSTPRSRSEPVADPQSARELLAMDDFASNHNGGLLLFGPDGELYAGTGDGGGGGDPERTAQDPRSPLGKLLRVDPPRRGEPAVAALGLRNPWRYSFDRETGDLWIGDVGQDAFEEIDSLAAADFAERRTSAGRRSRRTSRTTTTRRHRRRSRRRTSTAPRRRALLGHRRLRRPRPGAESLYGRYLYGDFCDGVLRSFTADAGADGVADDRELGLEVAALSSFGEDAAGRLYAVSLEGPVYRLEAAG